MFKESDSFQQNGGFFPWKPAAWLRVFGGDSFAFLQGQLSNDLRGLGTTGAVFGLWLNHKGRVLADSFVLRGAGENHFWVGSYFSAAEVIRKRLESFIVADDVVVEDVTSDWAGVSLVGGSVEDAVFAAVDGAVNFAGRRSSEATREWVYPRSAEHRVQEGLANVPELRAEEMERKRIGAGIPRVPLDIGPGELPNEGGLEAAAISYAKGCYLGQEVMARLKSMGQVRRRLMRVRGNGAWPALPAALFQGERKIGELRSATVVNEGFIGLALVSLLALRPDHPLSYYAASDPGPVWLMDTP